MPVCVVPTNCRIQSWHQSGLAKWSSFCTRMRNTRKAVLNSTIASLPVFYNFCGTNKTCGFAHLHKYVDELKDDCGCNPVCYLFYKDRNPNTECLDMDMDDNDCTTLPNGMELLYAYMVCKADRTMIIYVNTVHNLIFIHFFICLKSLTALKSQRPIMFLIRPFIRAAQFGVWLVFHWIIYAIYLFISIH